MQRETGTNAERRVRARAEPVTSRVEQAIPWIVDVLAVSGTPSILLAGSAARPRSSPVEVDRPVPDVELLVPPHRLRRAGMALAQQGFVRSHRGDRCDSWLRRGLYVDLHLALPCASASPARVFRLLGQRASRLDVAGVEVAVLDGAAQAALVALRAADDGLVSGAPSADAWRRVRAELSRAELARAREIAHALGAMGAWDDASAFLVDGIRTSMVSSAMPATPRPAVPARVRARAAWGVVARQVGDGAADAGVVDPSTAR